MQLENKFSKVTGDNIQTSITFLYMNNEHLEIKI